jgi:hypothetical protein
MDRAIPHKVSILFLALFFALSPGAVQVLASGPTASAERLTIPPANPQVIQIPVALAPSTDELVQDSGFEAGTPNPNWAEASTNFGTPLCTIASCGSGGGTGPRTGNWWAWFGGTSAVETGTLEQSGIIPRGSSATLSFFLEIPAADTPGFLRVLLDGQLLFEVTEADSAQYAPYTPVTIDIKNFANGVAHTLRFESTTDAGAVTNFFVDDVIIEVIKFPWTMFFPAIENSINNNP